MGENTEIFYGRYGSIEGVTAKVGRERGFEVLTNNLVDE